MLPERDRAATRTKRVRPHGPLRRAALAGSRRVTTVIQAPFGDVPGPFPARRRIDTSLDEAPSRAQERGMRAFWWDGFWGGASDSIVVNYLGLYLLAFGASASQVGLLSSLSSLFAALAFFPGARVAERLHRPKATVLISSGGFGRVGLLALAAIPFLASGGAAVWLVIAVASFRHFWAHFAVPAWTTITAETVPLGMRGRFLASRNFAIGLAALAVAPLAGLLIDGFTGMHGWQLVWIVAFVTGVVCTFCYARIPVAEHRATPAADLARPADGAIAQIMADRNFVAFLVTVAVWNVALHVAGPFFNVYLVMDLHASTAMVGFLAAIPSLTGLAGLAVVGRAMDRRGTKWLMSASGLLIPALPLAWILVTAAWQVIFINAFGGLLWAGYQLAAMNIVMVMAPPDRRARYAAAFQTLTFAAAFAGPLAGGPLVAAFGFKFVFFVSAAGRLVAALMLVRFVRAESSLRAAAG